MKTIITLFLTFSLVYSSAQIDTRGYASQVFSDVNNLNFWDYFGSKLGEDTCILRINVLIPGPAGKEEKTVRKTFEFKYALETGGKMSFMLVNPKNLKQGEKSWILCQVKYGDQSLLEIEGIKEGALHLSSAKIDSRIQLNPIERWDGESGIFSEPSVEVYYKTKTLPATFTDIRHWSEDQVVYVQWTTANEKDVEFYYLQKMMNDGSFENIDSIPANNSGLVTHYVAIDRNASAENIYQIVGKDRNFIQFQTHTFTVQVEFPDPVVLISPNPGGEFMRISVPVVNPNQQILVKVVNITGRSVKEELMPSDQTMVDISSLEPGIYSIYIDNVFIQRFVKN
jgi:hypothetical protein